MSSQARRVCHRFETVVMRCWDSSPERRPEFDIIRIKIDKFNRGLVDKRDDYYSQDEVKGQEMYINASK